MVPLSFEKLNKTYDAFFKDKTTDNFNLLYETAKDEFLAQHRRRLIASGLCTQNEADAIFDDVLLKLTSREYLQNFGLQLATSLSNARKDYIKISLRRNRHYEQSLGISFDESAPILKIRDEIQTEVEVLKKEDDQHQLIAYLSDPSQVDSDTTAIVSIFLQEEFESVRALAKALGLHPEAVSRKLRKLGHRYDANRFGNISDYLPEGLRVNRKYISA
ncbi:hypothetical protein ACIFQM_11110 [Paenibacillus sp. NRS-1782]|uniref:hypothetical protein n=1 Tax=unclassified Paenibacillus TaxID=185978 RepID=UPI003D274553